MVNRTLQANPKMESSAENNTNIVHVYGKQDIIGQPLNGEFCWKYKYSVW